MSVKIPKTVVDGVKTINFTKWNEFNEFICENMLDYQYFIWRGQRDNNWKLEPTLDRLLKLRKKINNKKIRELHLKKFKFSCRGRRGINPPSLTDDNDWWALGQHYGLATPLLDWTKSPFAAAYFAFEEEDDKTENRAIFGISKPSIEDKCKEIIKNLQGKGCPSIIKFIEPLSDENIRLVNQGGLFTRAPDCIDLESWIKDKFKGYKNHTIMFKIILPNTERNVCLRSLNRMNINHLSLFPDLFGASKFTNLNLTIDKY